MSLALYAFRLLLAATFAVAAVAKLRAADVTRHSVREFGVSERLAGPVARLLAPAELLAAFALIWDETAWWGALWGGTLLLLFTAAIIANLALGRHPACACFGQLSASSIGWQTVGRNVALGALATPLLWAGPAQQAERLTSPPEPGTGALVSALVAVLLIALATQALLVRRLREENRLLRAHAEAGATPGGALSGAGLPLGARAPQFRLQRLDRGWTSLDDLLSDQRAALLVFTDPDCASCGELLPDIARWQQLDLDHVTIAVVSRGAPRANRSEAERHNLQHLLLQVDREVASAFGVHVTPGAVIVAPDGRVGSTVALGVRAIRALAASQVLGTEAQ